MARMSGLLQEYETTPAPGTDESGSSAAPDPSAGTSNTDTGGTPETVPYARFKEVNDQLSGLREFKRLTDMGYDADSLASLAIFEAAYYRDPIATMQTMVDNLDLPQERRDALKEAFGSVSTDDTTVVPAQGESSTSSAASSEEPPAWAKPLLEDHQKRTAAEVEQGNQQMVDRMVDHWKQLDRAEQENLPEDQRQVTADRVILRYIASLKPRGDLDTVEKLAAAARSEFQEDRDSLLGAAVKRPNGPRAVPGSGVAVTPPEDFGGDIHKATRAAKAALEAGTLPGA